MPPISARRIVAFGRDHFLGACDRFGDALTRNDDDAVTIAEQVIAGGDRHVADRHRFAVAIRNPSLDDIGRREERAEHGKALREHEIGIARAAIHDVAEHAACGERLRGKFAHQRDLVVVRLADDDVTGRGLRQQRAPAEQALVARLRPVDMPVDCPDRSREP